MFQKAWAANQTDSSFTAPAATTTEPTGDGVIEVKGGRPYPVGSQAELLFFGAGSDNTTFDARVIGWARVFGGSLWMPTVLWQGTVTLSGFVGVSGEVVGSSDRLADTIVTTAGFGTEGQTCITVSPANDTPARLVLDTLDSEKLQLKFDMTGATSGNALVRTLSRDWR